MFDIKQHSAMAGNNWVNLVKEEIVKRCTEANILHIAVDTVSDEGTVYIKTGSLEDAGKVFRNELVTGSSERVSEWKG